MNEENNPEQTPQESAPQPEAEGAGVSVISDITKDDKTMAMIAHLLGIITQFVGCLIIYLIKKDDSPFVADQAKEALNFQITLVIGIVIAMVLNCTGIGALIGVPLMLAIGVINLIFCIVGGIKANDGVQYRYPFALRLIK